VGFAVTFEVFQGIFEFDGVLLQERVQFHGCFKPKQLTHLSPRQASLEIRFECQRFESRAGEVSSRTRQSIHYLVWESDGYVSHKVSIPDNARENSQVFRSRWSLITSHSLPAGPAVAQTRSCAAAGRG